MRGASLRVVERQCFNLLQRRGSVLVAFVSVHVRSVAALHCQKALTQHAFVMITYRVRKKRVRCGS